METIEKAETGDAIESGADGRNTNHPNILGESEGRNLHKKQIGGKRAGEGTAKRDQLIGISPAEQAVVFV